MAGQRAVATGIDRWGSIVEHESRSGRMMPESQESMGSIGSRVIYWMAAASPLHGSLEHGAVVENGAETA